MDFDELFSSVDRVAAHLPFPIHDAHQANAAFEAWREGGDASMKRVVDLWTYCFVRRYLLAKFAANRLAGAADLEQLCERVYRKIERKRVTVEDARRYASWVSVVCRNAYYNYARTAGRIVLFGTEGDLPVLVSEPREPAYDRVLLLDAMHAAIEDLPPYLREVAILKFVRELEYTDIEKETGLSLPIVRAYVSKIVRRLRRNEALARILGHQDDRVMR